MSAIVTNNFRANNAAQFVESFSEGSGSTTYYLFLGRPQAFGETSGGGTDEAPPLPLDNIDDTTSAWRDMIAVKKITAGDITYAVPRHNWFRTQVYDFYRSDYGSVIDGSIVETLSGGTDILSPESRMFVLSSANNVYKCIWNNKGGASLIEPTGASTEELYTADGYVWKFMYSMTATEIGKFVTSDFMACHSDSSVSAAAVDGSVHVYHVANGGSGYSNGTYSVQNLVGDGVGATFSVTVTSNSVSDVTLDSSGSGYTFGNCNIDSISGIGTPDISAIITPIISPAGGHGFDSIKELGGSFVMTNTILSGTAGDGDFVVDQEFRRIGVIKDPYDYGTTTICTSDTRNALKSLVLQDGHTGTFINDEVLSSSTGAMGLVVDWNPLENRIKYIQTQWTGIDSGNDLKEFFPGDIITSNSGATGIASVVDPSEIDYYSGDILYVENRKPITRAPDQTESIKLIIEF